MQAKWIKLDLHVVGSIVKTEQSLNSYYSKELGVKQLYNLECEVQNTEYTEYTATNPGPSVTEKVL